MGLFDTVVGYQPWWRASKERQESDLEECFLDSPARRDSAEVALEKMALPAPQHHRTKLSFWFTGLNVCILSLSVMINTGFPWSLIDSNSCVKATSSYSPILNSQPIELKTVHFNGTLYPTEDPAWSRKEKGDPEAEAIWEFYEIAHTFPITREDIVALGKNPDTAAKYSEDFGLGDEAYVASLDVQHKIHCLNELRQMTFDDYGEDVARTHVHGQLWWIHLRHCVDMLAQDLICHADADVITYQWVDTQENPFPDFSLNRQCRNINDLISWRDHHKVDMRQYEKMRKPSSVKPVPMDPGYYAMYGFKKSELYPNGEGYGKLPPSDWFGVPPSKGIPADDRPHHN